MSILWNQMGSTMRSTIFNEWLAKALRNWHNTANECAPGIPTHAMPPVHLVPNYRGEPDGLQASPRKPCVENGGWETDSPSIPSSHKHRKHVVEKEDRDSLELTTTPTSPIQQANIFLSWHWHGRFLLRKTTQNERFWVWALLCWFGYTIPIFVFFLVVVSSEPSLGEKCKPDSKSPSPVQVEAKKIKLGMLWILKQNTPLTKAEQRNTGLHIMPTWLLKHSARIKKQWVAS